MAAEPGSCLALSGSVTALVDDALLASAADYVGARGIHVRRQAMNPEIPAAFDGLTITLNPVHDVESLACYLIHSYGSIAGWSTDYERVRAMFEELRDAKESRRTDPERLERAITAFRTFEERASEYGVWVLNTLGFGDVANSYSIFFRADLEAMTIFHRTGRAPVWRTFFTAWRDAVARGDRPVAPFSPRVVPAFRLRSIPRQEVTQEIDGR